MAHKYLLDTHALVWYLEGNPRLGAGAKAVIDDPQSQLVLLLIALAEAAYIIEKRRSSIPGVPELLERVRADRRIEIHPITLEVFEHGLTASNVPEMHDQLIVGSALYLQSLGHTVSILTRDATIVESKRAHIVWQAGQ